MTQPSAPPFENILQDMASFMDDLKTEDTAALKKLNNAYVSHYKVIETEYQQVLATGGTGTGVATRLEELRTRIVTRLTAAGGAASTVIDQMKKWGYDSGIQDAYELVAKQTTDALKGTSPKLVPPKINGSFSEPGVQTQYEDAVKKVWSAIPAAHQLVSGGIHLQNDLDGINAQFQSSTGGTHTGYSASGLGQIGVSDKINQGIMDGWKKKSVESYSQHYEKTMNAWFQPGWGEDPAHAMVAHEVGHAIQEHLFEQGHPYLDIPQKTGNVYDYDNVKSHGVLKAYANTSPQEQFAEAFSEILTTPKAQWSEQAKMVDDYVHKMMPEAYASGGAMTDAKGIIKAGFGTPNPDAYAAFAGASDTLWKNTLAGMPKKTAGDIIQAMRTAMLSGQNPKVTARGLTALLDGDRRRALTIARTEQMRAYRSASAASYRASKVVKSWMWHASLDKRMCFACLALHGTVWPKEELMEAHPACRCAMVPVTKTWAEMGIAGVPETGLGEPVVDVSLHFAGVQGGVKQNTDISGKGKSFFNSLSKAEQTRLIGGPGKYNAMTAYGQTLTSSPFVTHLDYKPNAIWGGMYTAKPLLAYGPGHSVNKAYSSKFEAKAKAFYSSKVQTPIYKAGLAAAKQKVEWTKASKFKYETKAAQQAALKKAAGDSVALKEQAALLAKVPLVTSPKVNTPIHKPTPSLAPPTGSQTTSKPKPGSPEFKLKVSEAVKAANAKKAALKADAAANDALALKVHEATATKAAEKAAMSAKIGYGVKVANAKKAGLPPPPPPDYEKIKADTKAVYMAKPVAKNGDAIGVNAFIAKQTAPKTAPKTSADKAFAKAQILQAKLDAAAAKQAAKIPKGELPYQDPSLAVPLQGEQAYNSLKAAGTIKGMKLYEQPSAYTGAAFIPMAPDKLVQHAQYKIGDAPKMLQTQQNLWTAKGVKLYNNLDEALKNANGVLVVKPPPGGFKIVSGKTMNNQVWLVRSSFYSKISAAEAKYGVGSLVATKLSAILQTGSSYRDYSQLAIKKKFGTDGVAGAEAGSFILTNPKLLKGTQAVKPVGSYDHTVHSGTLAIKAAEAAAVKSAKLAEAAALRMANYVSTSTTHIPTGTFSPTFDPEKHKVLSNFIRTKVQPVVPPIKSLSGIESAEAKYAVSANLADRLVGNPHWEDFIKRKTGTFINDLGNDIHQKAVSNLVQRWASSSFDSYPEQVMMQRAAIEEFGLSRSGFDTRVRLAKMDQNPHYQAAEQDLPVYRAFLRAMYDHTQAEFAKAGITEVSAYRGATYHSTDSDTSTVSQSLARKPKGEVAIDPNLGWQPMSSWSSRESTAMAFAGSQGSGGDIKLMHSATIPVSRIVGTTRTGYGCLNEAEIVVLDTPGSVVSTVAY